MAKQKIDFSNSILNALSLEQKANEEDIRTINLDDIIKNKQNFYSTKELSELMENIIMLGLHENLVVNEQTDGRFLLISGHRRLEALKMAVEKGNEKFKKVRCLVLHLKTPEEIQFHLLSGNYLNRDLSDWEKIEQYKQVKLLLEQLEEQGYSVTGRQREFIAKQIHVSSTQVQRYEQIDKKLSSGLKEEMKQGKIPLTVAEEASRLSMEKQNELQKKNEKITHAAIKEVKNNKNKDETLQEFKFTKKDINKIELFFENINHYAKNNSLQITETESETISANIKEIIKRGDEIIQLIEERVQVGHKHKS